MFLYNYQPNAILLNLGFFQIRWYSVILMLAIISGFFVFLKLNSQNNLSCHPEHQPCHPELVSGSNVRSRNKFWMTKSEIYNIFFYIIIFSIIGGRIIHVLSFYKYYSQNLLEIFYIWQGGIAFYGVLISALLVIFYFTKKINKFLLFTDIGIISLTLAQSIGRWGNYFNQELFGKACEYFWCIPISYLNTHHHPVFLYESLLMLLVFIVLWVCHSDTRRRRVEESEKPGTILSLYLIFHSIIRFFLEFLRTDIQPEFLNLRLFQYLAILEFLAGIILLVFVKKWYNKIVISNK